MKRIRSLFPVLLVLTFVLSACGAASATSEPTVAPTEVPAAAPTATPPLPAPTSASAADLPAGALRLVMAADGNQAQFSVREQLANLTLPNDAVGTTSSVSGNLVILPDGQLVAGESRVVVDLTTLKTDSTRRDGYIQRSTLETGIYPEAIFVPTSTAGLPAALPTGGPVAFQLTGDLTVHGVTRPVTWDVIGDVSGNTLRGTATTTVTFADFGMTPPRVGPVLSVEDTINLRLDFTFHAQ